VRRLVQHAIAAAGISVLTVGAVAGSLSSGAGGTEVTSAAPSAVTWTPAAGTMVAQADTDARERRIARDTRAAQRAELATVTAATARERALVKQRAAVAKKEAALEKKRKAEAEERAERKKKRAKAEAKAKRLGYDPDTSSPKSIARQIMDNKFGWGDKQFDCYNKIIMRESVWKVDADNPTSSAYGIPQALPGSKMASEGSDWRTNPATQIKWGLGYVKDRYGTPCEAWGFKSSHGWY
jgi:hypothetical protein